MSGISPETQALLNRAKEIGLEALSEVERLEADRAELDEKIKELRSIARRFGASVPSTGKVRAAARARGDSGGHPRVSKRLMVRAGEEILTRWPDSPFSADDLQKVLGVSKTSVMGAALDLRTREFLRAAGKDGKANLYRVMDVHVLDQLRAEVESNGKASH